VSAIVGVARWWALSLIATGLDLYDAIPRPKPVVREVLHWTDGSDD
jgi:hypothetical protein